MAPASEAGEAAMATWGWIIGTMGGAMPGRTPARWGKRERKKGNQKKTVSDNKALFFFFF